MNPKAWLENNCPLKGNAGHKCVTANQKGRISAEHHEILAKNDFVPAVAPVKAAAPAKTSAPKSVGIPDVNLESRFDERFFQANATVNGKSVPVGMRECCSTCYSLVKQHWSLTDHKCDSPSVSTVLGAGTVKVSIVPRTTPLPAIRW